VLIEVNGAALHCEKHGDGVPLVLIHGGLSSSSQWQPVVPELADGFRVITPDTRGHGRSTNPPEKLSYALIADDIAALIAALGLQRPAVGGWSDGGQVTLELGARHPGAAGALIVGAAYPDFDAGGLRDAHRTLLGADERGVPDLAHLDTQLGEFAEEIKALHPGGPERWRRLVSETAPMWLDYQGLGPDELQEHRGAGPGARRRPRRVHPARPVAVALPGAAQGRAGHLPTAEPRRADSRARARPREPDPGLRPPARSSLTHRHDEGVARMLANAKAYSGLAVRDMEEARRFYGEALGLKTSEEYGLMWLHLAGGRDTLVYEQSDATPASFTILNFEVDDIDEAVDALAARGVRFERYEGVAQDEKGVFRDEGPYIAWFKDPSGNVLSVLQEK
jgi:pimeloyl-ACP methyl ester carboxylesterase